MIFLLSSRRNLGSHLIWLTGWIGLVALLLPFLSGGDVTQSAPPVYAPPVYGTLYALDPQNGRVRWSFAGGDNRLTYLHATATSVYFAVPNDSASSFDLVALQASSGESQWHIHLAVKYIEYFGANATDLVFGIGVPEDPNAPSEGHTRVYVLAISQANGHVHWAHYMHSDYGFGPTSVRNDLIVVTQRGGIWAWAAQVFDAQSGMERWSTEYTNFFPDPVLTDHYLVIPRGSDSASGTSFLRLEGRNLTDGAVRWTATSPAPSHTFRVIGDIFYTDDDYTRASFALSATDGRMLWRIPNSGVPGGNLGGSQGIILLDTGNILNAAIAGVDARSGARLWEQENPILEFWPEVLQGNLLFRQINETTGRGEGLSVIDITSGQMLWTVPGWWDVGQSVRSLLVTSYGAADFGPSQSIAVSDGQVYIGEHDPPGSSAVFYAVALDARTGMIRWRHAFHLRT